jgi:FixJ family two-component response regulator
VVVDDDDDVRRALARLLRAAGYEVLTYGSAAEFLQQALHERPTCLVLDLRMPDTDGMALHEALQNQGRDLPIVFLTGHGDIRTSVRAIRTGAIDFLEKPVEDDRLLEAVGRAIAHEEARRSRNSERAAAIALMATLTPREREVCCLAARGMPNNAIASQLGISLKTVKVHRGRVMQKTGVASLADLVRLVELLPQKPEQASPSD